jgi:hypothetical protein
MVRWDDAPHLIWNGLATLVWLATACSIIRVPAEQFRKGWRSKGLWLFLGLGPSFYFDGFYVPLGWIVALGAYRLDRVQ